MVEEWSHIGLGKLRVGKAYDGVEIVLETSLLIDHSKGVVGHGQVIIWVRRLDVADGDIVLDKVPLEVAATKGDLRVLSFVLLWFIECPPARFRGVE